MPWSSDAELSDCLLAVHGGVETRFYFNPAGGEMIGIEMQLSDEEDPCEIEFDDMRPVDGQALPHQWLVRHGDEVFVELAVTSYDGVGSPSKGRE
jgi:hypothetical protein